MTPSTSGSTPDSSSADPGEPDTRVEETSPGEAASPALSSGFPAQAGNPPAQKSPAEPPANPALALIRDVADFPKPGVLFKDITPLLADPAAFGSVVTALAEPFRDQVDLVVGIEARGFIFAAPVALELGRGFVPVRKPGKLPHETESVSYDLEYGSETLQMHRDAVAPGQRVLIVDDVLATGGTARAAADLVERAGGTVSAVAVLMELSFLPGREAIAGLPLHVLHSV